MARRGIYKAQFSFTRKSFEQCRLSWMGLMEEMAWMISNVHHRELLDSWLVPAEWVDGSDHEPYYYGKHLNILRKLLTHKEQMATNVRYQEMLQTSIWDERCKLPVPRDDSTVEVHTPNWFCKALVKIHVPKKHEETDGHFLSTSN